MSRTRPPDAGRRPKPASGQKIDTPVLIVSALTAFFATLFATLLVLRPEPSGPAQAMPADAPSEPIPVRASAPRVDQPRVDAPPPESAPKAAHPAPKRDATLRAQLEELGIECAEGIECYPD